MRFHPVRAPRNRRAFTLTELLVAIGIIALLIGILLPALGHISQKSRKTATVALMQQFADACNHFQQELGYPPGLVPEDVLYYDSTQNGNVARLSGTENALLHLMGGGYRSDDLTAAEWNSLTAANGWTTISFQKPDGSTLDVKISINEMVNGKGPRIGGKQYERFFNARPTELVAVEGQVGEMDFDPNQSGMQGLPDLVDAWGQPIMYIRAARGTGPLVGNINAAGTVPPAQFGLYGLTPYTQSAGLGELGQNQLENSLFVMANGNEIGNPPVSGPNPQRNAFLAQVIRHAAMGNPAQPVNTGVARGRFAAFSAGKDGIYFSSSDGPGAKGNAVLNIIAPDLNNGGNAGPTVVDDYDDIRVFGGS